MFFVIVSFHNDNSETIWNKLAKKLGRDPTSDECKAEVFRILDEAKAERIENENRPVSKEQ
jgi:hypothetical protein